ncbi:MAG: histidine--tRNA ligase [Gemmatimonadaceae bacterium]
MSRKPLPGFRDFYPVEFAQRAHIMRAWRAVAQRFGFVEYDGPPLEPLDLYTRKSGEEIVGQLYNFQDKGGREVALRPEMTPTFARMVGSRANTLRKPVRWFSMPQLFRYERQQRGRLREHFQLNVDIVGETDVAADAELLAVAIEVMRELGLTADDVRARVSDRRLLTALLGEIGVTADQMGAAYAVIDKIEREPRDVSTRRLVDAGMDPAIAEAVHGLVAPRPYAELRAEHAHRPAAAEHFARLDAYLRSLDALGVGEWVQVDLTIVRGLAYYTGIVFELFDARGELRAICGGGRYDNLLAALGNTDLPALGFGLGDVVLTELLRDRGLLVDAAPALDYWVAPADDDQRLAATRVASILRRDWGCAVEYPLRAQGLGKQLKAASAAGARLAVIVHDDQRATVRDLSRRAQVDVALSSWLAGDWTMTGESGDEIPFPPDAADHVFDALPAPSLTDNG